jgi:hypothetical protein
MLNWNSTPENRTFGIDSTMLRRPLPLLAVIFGLAAPVLSPPPAWAKGKLLLRVVDEKTKTPIPFRIHLKNDKGIFQRLPQLPFWHDHVSAPGDLPLEVFRGNYFFEIDHGPEYNYFTGFFTINDGADDEKVVELKRAADLPAEGWWSGDLDVRRPRRDIEQAMQAEDLHIAPLITWSEQKSDWTKAKPPADPITRFDGNRFVHLLAGADQRNGGPIRLFNLAAPVAPADSALPLAALLPKLAELRAANPLLHIDVDAAAWDLPLLVARGLADSVMVITPALRRDKVVASPLVRPFESAKYLPTTGPAEFPRDIYYHLLNCGLRIPPTAGSGSGIGTGPTTVGNPVGYNRTYVEAGRADFSYEAWFAGLAAGRVTISNGPLIRPKADDAPPGFLFASESEPVSLDLAMNLTTRDKISYVEIIQNGRLVQNLPIRDWAEKRVIAPVVFKESGWCLIRIPCDHPQTYRYAMTAPWYVSIGGKHRVSRSSAQFFLDWVEERAAKLIIADAEAKATADKEIEFARAYWKKLVDEANAP